MMLRAGPTAAAISGSLGARRRCQRQLGYLNDLWEFNPSTNEWTWMGGSSTMACDERLMASRCVRHVGNACCWKHPRRPSDTLRAGPTAAAISGSLGALATMPTATVYCSTTFGSSIPPRANGHGWAEAARSAARVPGVYGTLGTPAAGNIPGDRYSAASWTDSSGNLWLFGGYGYDANGNTGYLNDLWEFNPTANEWAWMGGSSTVGSNGGSLRSLRHVGNACCRKHPRRPLFRCELDRQQRQSLALWGLGGYDAHGIWSGLNDLWKYQPPATKSASALANLQSARRSIHLGADSNDLRHDTRSNDLLHDQRNHADHEFDCVQRIRSQFPRQKRVETIAAASGYSQSAVSAAAYTIILSAATPTFSLPAGTYSRRRQ